MEKIRCITFDKKAQNNIPKEIRDKMNRDRELAAKNKPFRMLITGPPGSGKTTYANEIVELNEFNVVDLVIKGNTKPHDVVIIEEITDIQQIVNCIKNLPNTNFIFTSQLDLEPGFKICTVRKSVNR